MSAPFPLWLWALALWMLLAALGQLAYLAKWPMDLWGVPIAPSVATLIAVVRLGYYAAIGFGLLRCQPAAWAAACCEMARTLLLFIAVSLVDAANLARAVYPGAWTQGLLSGFIPLLIFLAAAVAGGWRPSFPLELWVTSGARFVAAGGVVATLSLRREYPHFVQPGENHWHVLARLGLPPALVLMTLEGLAALLARAALPPP